MNGHLSKRDDPAAMPICGAPNTTAVRTITQTEFRRRIAVASGKAIPPSPLMGDVCEACAEIMLTMVSEDTRFDDD